MYTPVMFDFTTEDRYWIEQENLQRFLFIEKENAFDFSLFLKKNFLTVRIDNQCSQSGDVLTRAVQDLDNGCTAERVCNLMGVQLNGCIAERVCSLHGCAALPTRIPRYLSDGTNALDDKRQEQTCDRVWSLCFVSPTISYLLLQSKAVLTAYRASVSSSPILCSAILLNAMHIGDCYRDFPLRPACCRYPLVSRSRQKQHVWLPRM